MTRRQCTSRPSMSRPTFLFSIAVLVGSAVNTEGFSLKNLPASSHTNVFHERRCALSMADGDWNEPDKDVLKAILEKGLKDNAAEDANTVNLGINTDDDKLNPLSYDKSSRNSVKNTAGYSTRISLRATRMQDLNQSLLDAVTSADRNATMKSIMEEYKEFLLEPLEDEDAVLEADSIYKAGMSRADRYQAYRTSMNERIEASRNLKVKTVLEAMRDFVLANE